MKNNKGFVALTLVITVASLLFAFSFTQSIEIMHFFDQTERKLYRLMNHYYAYNCIDHAVLNLAHDYFYEVITPVEIKDLHCTIDVVRRHNEIITIDVHGNFKNMRIKRSAIVRLYDNKVEIISID